MKMNIDYNEGTIDFYAEEYYSSDIHLTLDDPIMETKEIEFPFLASRLNCCM